MRRFAFVLAAVAFAFAPTPASAQSSSPPQGGSADARFLSPGCRTAEVYGGYLVESWNFNNRPRVKLAGVSAIGSTTLGDGWGLAVEALGTNVRQRGPNAFVGGMLVMVRRRLAQSRSVVLFVEGGVGASYSSVIVPEQGTRFNYLAQGGIGVARHFTPHLGAIVTARVFHLSNASLNGSAHNPDIEAVGGRVGVFVTF